MHTLCEGTEGVYIYRYPCALGLTLCQVCMMTDLKEVVMVFCVRGEMDNVEWRPHPYKNTAIVTLSFVAVV